MILLGIACGYFLIGWTWMLFDYWYCMVVHPEKYKNCAFDDMDIINFIFIAICFSIVWFPSCFFRRKKCSKEQ